MCGVRLLIFLTIATLSAGASTGEARGRSRSSKAAKSDRKITKAKRIRLAKARERSKSRRRSRIRAKAKKSKAKPRRRKDRPTKRRSKRRRRRRRDRFPPMELYQANARERLTLRIYDRRGRAIRRAAWRLNRFLRCRKTNRRRRIHWRLVRSLYRISRAFPGKTIRVYSAFRHPRISRLKRSYHTRGRAIDLRVDGVSNKKLRDFVMKRFKRIGVGYYPKTPFIHFDVRPKRSAFWVDFSGSGEDSRYAKNPYGLLKAERKGVPMKEPPRKVLLIIAEQGEGQAGQAVPPLSRSKDAKSSPRKSIPAGGSRPTT